MPTSRGRSARRSTPRKATKLQAIEHALLGHYQCCKCGKWAEEIDDGRGRGDAMLGVAIPKGDDYEPELVIVCAMCSHLLGGYIAHFGAGAYVLYKKEEESEPEGRA